MKFLVLTKNRREVQRPEDRQRTHEISEKYLQKKVSDGSIEAHYNMAPDGGVAIVNAQSHEALHKMLMEYPGFDFIDFEVHPLLEAETAHRIATARHGKA
jgi:muconolactone delta-isomerase